MRRPKYNKQAIYLLTTLCIPLAASPLQTLPENKPPLPWPHTPATQFKQRGAKRCYDATCNPRKGSQLQTSRRFKLALGCATWLRQIDQRRPGVFFSVSLCQDGFTTASAGATNEFACVCPGPSLTVPDGRYHVAHPLKLLC